MTDNNDEWRGARLAVYRALREEQDPQAANVALGHNADVIAKALGSALPGSPEYEAKCLLEFIARLFKPEPWPGFFASPHFEGRLAKRKGWKRWPRPQSLGQKRRAAAARRVYELMAEQAMMDKIAPKQEAAILQVMSETGLPRSKIMLALAEYREAIHDPFGPNGNLDFDVTVKAEIHKFLLQHAMRSVTHVNDCPPDLQD